jgi:MoaA/NifB/PqqE/SkfB family radical SAM enzyme
MEVDLGRPGAAYLEVFSDLPLPPPASPWPRQLELALSISCNLQCVMCNGELSSSIRTHREHRPPLPRVFDEQFFLELDDFLPHLERITFLGGEPFYGAEPLRVMRRLIELRLTPRCHVTTNGTRWGSRLEEIVRRLPMHLAVSVDGASQATVEAIRVGVDFGQLVTNIERARTVCRSPDHGFSLTFCLMTNNWHEFADVLAWGDRLDCDVLLNTVTNPPRFSLHLLPREELDRIVDALAARDPWCRANLGRNLPTWSATLEHLAHLSSAHGGARENAADAARRAAEEWSEDGVVHTMDADDALIIRDISPDAANVFGADMTPVIGASTISFMQTLGPRLGRIVETSVTMTPEGTEERRFSYSDGSTRTTLVAAMARTPTGERWWLAARRTPEDGTSVTLGRSRGSASA